MSADSELETVEDNMEELEESGIGQRVHDGSEVESVRENTEGLKESGRGQGVL